MILTRIYPNGSKRTLYSEDPQFSAEYDGIEGKPDSWKDFNLTHRPGCFLFIDGKYVGGGTLTEAATKEFVAKHEQGEKDRAYLDALSLFDHLDGYFVRCREGQHGINSKEVAQFREAARRLTEMGVGDKHLSEFYEVSAKEYTERIDAEMARIAEATAYGEAPHGLKPSLH